MRFTLACLALLSASSLSFADSSDAVLGGETTECYKLSQSRTTEMMCVTSPVLSSNLARPARKVEFITVSAGRRTIHATFDFELLGSARCMDCNGDILGISNPTNSFMNKLNIEFDGKISYLEDGTTTEQGRVFVGNTEFNYVKMGR